MAKSMTVSFPHELTPAEVKRRLVDALAEARATHGELLKDNTENWSSDNQLDFIARAMGQTVSCSVRIELSHVLVTVTLPMLLAIFASKLKPQIEAEGQKLLGK